MKISELLITESEMLLESYRDFKRVWNDAVQSEPSLASSKASLLTTPSRLEALLRDDRKRAILMGNQNLVRATQRLGTKNPIDITSWLAGFRSMTKIESVPVAIEIFDQYIKNMEEMIDEEIKNRTPSYDIIKKTSDYIIFDAKNFAATQKLRNQVKSTWCIGSEDSYFKSYGEERGNKTLIVFFLKQKEGMVFHVNNRGGGIITSHDNQREWKVTGGDAVRSRGHNPIYKELKHYLSDSDLQGFVRATGMKIADKYLQPEPERTKSTARLQPYMINNLRSNMRGVSQYGSAYEETRIRIAIRDRVSQKTERIFDTGDVSRLMTEVKSIMGLLMNMVVDLPDTEQGIKEAADAFVCAIAILHFLRDIQEEIAHNRLESHYMRSSYFAFQTLDLGGRFKPMSAYKSAMTTTAIRTAEFTKAVTEYL